MATSQYGLDPELLRVLTSGDEARVEELLARHGDGHSRTGERVTISVQLDAATTETSAPLPPPPNGEGPSALHGVTTGGSTALHLVASRGHAGLARRVCELVPSLLAARDGSLDTPLHRAAKAGHREVVACLLSAMRAGGGEDAAAALRARNRLGATALYEAVRNGHTETVDLLATEAPELAALTTNDGVSPLYLAAMAGSAKMVRALLRRSPDGTPSLASFAGPEGRNALHAAAAKSKKIVREILEWEQGPALLSKADSSGKTPLHYAVSHRQHGVLLLFLNAQASLARVSDNQGLFPVHVAAMMGNIQNIIDLVERCPDFAELVDSKGRNFLHCAIEHDQENVVRFICRNGRLGILLNAMDYEGNTPLHLAVEYGHPRMVSSLLQTMTVDVGITNRDGLTAADLAYSHLEPGLQYFLNPRAVVKNCLYWTRAPVTLGTGGDHVDLHSRMSKLTPAATDEEHKDMDGITATTTIASVLIATVTFAAGFTVPGGYVADDHPRAGTAVLARRFAFRAFVASDALAFLCSIVATCFLVYGGAWQVPPVQRRLYQWTASGLLPPAAQLMVAAFAFGIHVVLGGEANRWLVTLIYVLALATVLLCFPEIWDPFYLGKAIWRRAGWRGLVNVHRRPASLKELFWLLITSFLFKNLMRPLFAVLISVTFVVSVALNIALQDY